MLRFLFGSTTVGKENVIRTGKTKVMDETLKTGHAVNPEQNSGKLCLYWANRNFYLMMALDETSRLQIILQTPFIS